jgi:hypothetical protein
MERIKQSPVKILTEIKPINTDPLFPQAAEDSFP